VEGYPTELVGGDIALDIRQGEGVVVMRSVLRESRVHRSY